MGDVTSSGTQAPPAGKAGYYLAVYVGLVVLTGVAAVMLVSFNVDLGKGLGFDDQSDPQRVATWRGAAALAYTSGAGIGQIFALVAGMPARRWAGTRGVNGVLVAILAGIGLGLVDLASAFVAAAPRLRDLARVPELRSDDNTQVIDPGLMHHGVVFVAMALTLVLFAIASGLGFVLARRPVALRALVVPPFLLYALFIRAIGMITMFALTHTWT